MALLLLPFAMPPLAGYRKSVARSARLLYPKKPFSPQGGWWVGSAFAVDAALPGVPHGPGAVRVSLDEVVCLTLANQITALAKAVI